MELHYVPTFGMHGASRLESGKMPRLQKDLRIVLEQSNDELAKEAAMLILPLVDRVASDPDLSLLIAAGR